MIKVVVRDDLLIDQGLRFFPVDLYTYMEMHFLNPPPVKFYVIVVLEVQVNGVQST